MSKIYARAAIVLVLLYVVGAVLFATFHYTGARPPIPTILGDFHAWVASPFTSSEQPAPAAPVPPPAPPPTPVPEPPTFETPSIEETDPVAVELKRIEKELLPEITEKARKLRASERGDGVEYDRVRSEAMAALGEARTYLNALLEKDPHHRRANKLWSALQELYASLKRL